MNAADIRAAVLGASDITTDTIAVPAWNVTLTLRSLTAKARDTLQEAMGDDKSTSRFYAAVVAAGVVDDQGQQVFTADDVSALQDKQGGAITAVAQKVMQISGMAEGAVDTAEKNSEAAPSGDSHSA